jgi:Hsp20/alpha crystallin family
MEDMGLTAPSQEVRARTRATLLPSTTDAVISIEQVLGSPAITNVNGVGQRIPTSGARTTPRFHGEFGRSITLPEGTQRDQIQASFDDGLVEIVVEGACTSAESSRIALHDRSKAVASRTPD